MDSSKTINFRIHHCRRDLNDSAEIIKKCLHGEKYDNLRKAISASENLFAISAKKYPPLPDFNMPQAYFDCNWGSSNSSSTKFSNSGSITKVRDSIEKAGRRSGRFLSDQEFSMQRKSLEYIVEILNSFK